MKHADALWTNFNHLYTRILNDHKTKLSREVIIDRLNKEVRRLAKAIIEDRVGQPSFKIIKVTVTGNQRSSRKTIVRSSGGFSISIDSSNMEEFKKWAFSYEDKLNPVVKMVRFGNGDKPYKVNEGRTVDPEMERLNIRHGIN